ncbi:MAG: 2-oxoacid:ferredoxin oxidoreductase subunit alpha [Saccharolobus sp.]|uniref:2-oxoacid:ferredoxin oxidoreductase subunit alpha n=1 Tax=Saccharolobus sp. TaxID=2100761 RepID=UPI0028CEE350|nr:2-oxoacid:ferredoxin oxidoreductase subunit alpha [Saccharolobus sp.]MDT7862456.1 2-oxoacid:ferredoxin oxidoreductase subunit alpha [Saccharolobus sp.]
MRISWMIGGAQGSGVDTSANIFGNAVAANGYYIYGNREYYSNIKGRHSYFNLTISDKPPRSIAQQVEILTTFDAETIFQHFTEVKDVLIYNTEVENTKVEQVQSMEPEIAEEVTKILKEKGYGTTVKDVISYLQKEKGVKVIPINYMEILKKVADQAKVPLSVADRAKNTIAIAASYKLLGLKEQYLINSINRTFRQEVFSKINTIAAQLVMQNIQPMYNLPELPNSDDKINLDGNTAVAIGKIYGGLRFQSYYPITPASDESVFIEAHQNVFTIDPKTGEKRKSTIVVVQAEDELAAINMASGAALTGVRAATATSGPGFSLMAEGIGWAGMNEAPVVVTYYIRGGPSTGQPTRTSQADLMFALNVSHGEFPRIVIASGDHVEAFQDAIWALNLAQKYQTPVIHLVDKALANSYSIIPKSFLGMENIRIEKGKIVINANNDYKRFEFTDDGISPFAPLGTARMHYTGDEHDEYGFIAEAAGNREKMYEKRIKKLFTADKEIPEEDRVKIYGNTSSNIAILTWGSPKGAILDAMEELESESIKPMLVQIRMFNPFPKNLMKKLLGDKEIIIDVEGNYFGQAGQVLKLNTGIEPTNYILKWNGRPMMRDEVKEGIKAVIQKGEKRVILHGGA